jgi:hypothetical protein
MGNHHGHGSHSRSGESTPTSSGSRKSISGAASHNEPATEKPSPLLPVEKLAKILRDKAFDEEGANGITQSVFTKYLFSRYPVLAEKLFQHFHEGAKSKNSYIDTQDFKLQCEKYLTVSHTAPAGST